MKKENKLYIVRKRVFAKSVADCFKKEKEVDADDIFIDEEWLKNNQKPADAMGYIENTEED